MSARLTRIRIYPVKSLDGQEVDQAAVRGGAGLAHDRTWRLVDDSGRVVNTKRIGAPIVAIRSDFDVASGRLVLWAGDSRVEGSLDDSRDALEAWLSERFGFSVRFEQNSILGFPDDLEASGPTVISRATLGEVSSWFGIDEDEARRRFRANIEIDGVPPFWEDRLYGPRGESRYFRVADARLEAVNLCARCAVPSRDSRSGEIERPDFAKAFSEKRRAMLPEWAEPSRFDHFYRLAVNTRIPDSEDGKRVAVGDPVSPDDIG